jgi:ubiquinol-cytochrome c reductase cytochrome c subunit
MQPESSRGTVAAYGAWSPKEGIVRRTLVPLAAVGLLTVLLWPATGGAAAPGSRRAATAGQDPDAFGRQLYQQSCASCHGPDPAGPSNYATVPSLKDVGGAAAVDWALRSGRMPWRSTTGPAVRGTPAFDLSETRALSIYVGDRVGDRDIPTVDPSQGDLKRGRDLYAQACAACHGMNGAGSSVGGTDVAPSLQGVDALTVGEAMKIGPRTMPVFRGGEYDAAGVNSIAAYTDTLDKNVDNPGGLPIGGKGPVPEGFVAWLIGLGVLVLFARMIGGRN